MFLFSPGTEDVRGCTRGQRAWHLKRADGMASKVGRSQLLGLSSFEVPEQTCFAWNRCSPWLFLWDSSVYCPASSLFHTLPRVMLRTQCPPTPRPVRHLLCGSMPWIEVSGQGRVTCMDRSSS